MRDGWPVRMFRWPAESGKGAILFIGGRGDIVEKYLEAFAHWHAAGWSVAAFDWRGQGGSGRFLADPMAGHTAGFSVWIDDLAEIWRRWSEEATGPKVAVGHSMGGHLLLRAVAERRIDPDALALVSPMLGFETKPLPLSMVAGLVGLLARTRLGKRMAWKTNERPTLPGASRQLFLTSDAERYADETWWKSEKPELALGPPTIGWLAEAYSSCVSLAGSKALAEVAIPILVLGTEGDRLVSPRAIRQVAAKLPTARLHMFGPEVAHEILREADGPRSTALSAIDDLLAELPR